jgi:anthranilate synthase/aminodeoxychorismate synthase-like glutamine amidotransferase
MNVLFIDNFDSFTFNLVDELDKRGATVEVWRNDIDVEEATRMALALDAPRLVVLSPGPGAPAEAGCCVELVRRLAEPRVPLLGVCLGHQAMVEAFGGEVGFAGEVVHGKAASIEHDGTGPFEGLANPMRVARYHSLVARRVPDALRVTATAGELVMAVTHRDAPMVGVQFHPESILTPEGGLLMEGILDWATRV